MRYHLDDLGWYQFEWLTQAILKNMLGPAIEAWGGSGDWGRDAYCRTDLKFGEKTVKGPHVFQCKFVEEANAAGADPMPLLRKAVQAECARIKKRERNDIAVPTSLILITNASLSATERTALEKIIAESLGCTFIQCWDGKDVCAQLDSMPTIRQSFPQLLSIRDINELIHQQLTRAQRQRSNVSLERAKLLLPIFVPTNPHREALNRLDGYGFVVLSGPPEAGKTAIASMIALQKVAEGWNFFDVTNPQDFFHLYDADQQQVYIADDLFGQTEYSPTRGDLWAPELDKILHSLDENHWFIFTSRSTPLRLALQRIELQGRAEYFPDPSAVIVDCRLLSIAERALILFRHAVSANLSPDYKSLVRALAPTIVSNSSLTPERIRRFVETWLPELVLEFARTQQMNAIEKSVSHSIAQPTDRMTKSFMALPRDHQLLLFACLNHDHEIEASKVIDSARRIFDGMLQTEPQNLVSDLMDHFLYQTDRSLHWIHPSWRDLVITCLTNARAERKAFLTNADPSGLNLAMSTGGGADGTRDCPLLQDKDDAEIFYNAIIRIASGTRGWLCVNLLKSLNHLLKQTPSKAPLSLRDLLPGFLRNLVNYWNSSRPPSAEEVSIFYQLCTIAGISEMHPTVWSTWREAWRNIIHATNENDYPDSIEDFASEWKDPISLWYDVRANHPMLFADHRREKKYKIYVEFFLDEIDRYLDELDPEDISDPENENSVMENVKDVLGDLEGMFPSLRVQINSSHRRLTRKQSELPEERYYASRAPKYNSPENENILAMPTIDVPQLFSSL